MATIVFIVKRIREIQRSFKKKKKMEEWKNNGRSETN